MGYGARLAYGCNIGAYLGGIVSGSFAWLAVGHICLCRQQCDGEMEIACGAVKKEETDEKQR